MRERWYTYPLRYIYLSLISAVMAPANYTCQEPMVFTNFSGARQFKVDENVGIKIAARLEIHSVVHGRVCLFARKLLQ